VILYVKFPGDPLLLKGDDHNSSVIIYDSSVILSYSKLILHKSRMIVHDSWVILYPSRVSLYGPQGDPLPLLSHSL
jgi:hypothetical protein